MANEVISKEIWKEYAPLYSTFTPLNQEELFKYISKFAFGKVLDAGTGVGKFLPYIVSLPNVTSVDAIDINDVMLSEAKKFVDCADKEGKINLFKFDVNKINKINDFYDVIYLTNVSYSISNLIPLLKKVYSKLNYGGRLILSNPKRNINMNDIDKKIKEDNSFSGSDYERYIQINKILTGENTATSTYNTSEIVDILKLIGFKVDIKNLRDDFYYGYLFSITAEKI